jgi:hypothetical protein
MALRIEDDEFERLVAEMAAEAGETKKATVIQAMRLEWQRRRDLRRQRREELRRLYEGDEDSKPAI